MSWRVSHIYIVGGPCLPVCLGKDLFVFWGLEGSLNNDQCLLGGVLNADSSYMLILKALEKKAFSNTLTLLQFLPDVVR